MAPEKKTRSRTSPPHTSSRYSFNKNPRRPTSGHPAPSIRFQMSPARSLNFAHTAKDVDRAMHAPSKGVDGKWGAEKQK